MPKLQGTVAQPRRGDRLLQLHPSYRGQTAFQSTELL